MFEQIDNRDNASLDISWLEAESSDPDYTISEMLELMQEKSDNIAEAVARLRELLSEVEE